MDVIRNTSRSVRTGLGTLLLSTAALLAATPATAEPAATRILHQQADGSLIAFNPKAPNQPPQQLIHRPDAVASDCITLKRRPMQAHRQTSVLHNRCDYDVVVAHCLEDSAHRGQACTRNDARNISTTRLKADGTLTLGRQATPDTQVNWVACRGDSEIVSRLIEGGTRGECLLPSIEPLVADTRR